MLYDHLISFLFREYKTNEIYFLDEFATHGLMNELVSIVGWGKAGIGNGSFRLTGV